MKRTSINLFVDIMAFAGFALLTTSGVLMRYVLPPGSGHGSTIWGLDRHEWGGIHFWISAGFFLVLALHLALHWRWIASVVSGRPREGSAVRAGLGVIGFAAVVAFAIAPLVAPVEQRSGENQASPLSGHRYEGVDIRGSMTLREIETSNGLPAAYLVESLGLPDTVSGDERLGQLKQKYGFGIDEVRRIVVQYGDRETPR